MNRTPLDSSEQRIFLRTLVLASLAGCTLFGIIAVARGGALAVPALTLLAALLATGVVFGWFGKAADDEEGEW